MTRDKKRIKKILKLIEVLWSQSPDQRFFQLLINNSTLAYYKERDPWYFEDDNLFKALEFQVKQLLKTEKKSKERC